MLTLILRNPILSWAVTGAVFYFVAHIGETSSLFGGFGGCMVAIAAIDHHRINKQLDKKVEHSFYIVLLLLLRYYLANNVWWIFVLSFFAECIFVQEHLNSGMLAKGLALCWILTGHALCAIVGVGNEIFPVLAFSSIATLWLKYKDKLHFY